MERRRATPNTPATMSGAPATDGRSPSLWFGAPTDDQDRRLQLTRERVVAEALAVIAHDGAHALTMRRLAARLGVVPGALYHHVRNKQQLQDLFLDGVLAEVDLDLTPPWAGPSSSRSWPTGSARCSRPIPGSPASSRPATRSGPHSLALAEAFLAAAGGRVRRPPSRAGLPAAGLHHRLCRQHPATSVNEQRVRDQAIRSQLHQFFRSLPPDRFPPWSPWASTSGSTTATNGSPPASRCWLMGWNTPATPHRPAPKRRPTTTTTTRGRQPSQQTTDGDTQRRRTR